MSSKPRLDDLVVFDLPKETSSVSDEDTPFTFTFSGLDEAPAVVTRASGVLEPISSDEVEGILGYGYKVHSLLSDLGSTSKVYNASFLGDPRAVKVAETPNSDYMLTMVEKGYDANNERDIMEHLSSFAFGSEVETGTEKLDGIIRLLDVRNYIDRVGSKRTILVYDKSEGQSLEHILDERVKNRLGGLEFEHVDNIAKKGLKTLQFLSKAGVYHRDLKPGNFFVNLKTGKVELSDFGLASKIDEMDDVFNGTQGGRHVYDPKHWDQSGKTKYDVDSELYQFSRTLLESALGETSFLYNPHETSGTNLLRVTSLLNDDGTVNAAAHEQAVEDSLSQLTGSNKRLKKFLRRGLTLNEENRFTSVEQAQEVYNKTTMSWGKKHNTALHYGAAILATVALVGSISGYQNLKQNARDANMLDLTPTLSPNGLEVDTSVLDMELTHHSSLTQAEEGDTFQHFEKKGFVRYRPKHPGKQGFNVRVELDERYQKIFDKNAASRNKFSVLDNIEFPGRAYLTGYEGVSFTEKVALLDSPYGNLNHEIAISDLVPKEGLEPGFYGGFVEVYAPANEARRYGREEDNKFHLGRIGVQSKASLESTARLQKEQFAYEINMKEKGLVLLRKPFTLVVGDDVEPRVVSDVFLNQGGSIVSVSYTDIIFKKNKSDLCYPYDRESKMYMVDGSHATLMAEKGNQIVWLPDQYKRVPMSDSEKTMILYKEHVESENAPTGHMYIPLIRINEPTTQKKGWDGVKEWWNDSREGTLVWRKAQPHDSHYYQMIDARKAIQELHQTSSK